MAQSIPKSRCFEEHWRPRLNLAVRLLQRFQERWLRADSAFPSREAVASLLHVFAFDFYGADFFGYTGTPSDELWNRSLDDWVESVASPEVECARLCPKRAEVEYEEFVETFHRQLLRASSSWESDPHNPTCEELVQWMLDELVARRFVVVKWG